MNRIDNLIIKARQLAGPGLELTVAIIERDGHSWAALTHLSDGTGRHPPTIHRATYSTLEAAVEHIRAVAREHPNSRDVPVIIDDLG